MRSWGYLATVAVVVGSLSATTVAAQEKQRLKLHMSFPTSTKIIGTAVPRLVKDISDASNGTLEFRVFEPGALVPAIQYFDAVSTGSVDAAWGNGGFLVGKVPALVMFASVPFGPRLGEYLAWMKFGGGEQLHDEIQGRHGIKPITCGMIAPESSGWFRKEIKSLDDLKGLKMRFLGLGAKVMEKFGVSTQLLAGGDIYPALELGTIDATEFSMPVIDEGLGFHQVAKHNYYPGWHQQATFLDLSINKKRYDGLSDHHKLLIRMGCEANITNMLVEGEATQFPAMERMKEKGVVLHRWPDDVLEAFRKAWQEVAAEESQKDPEFKRVYESYLAFREKYATWRDLGYLK